MATILEFRASIQETSQRSQRHQPRSAEIVIFPGIRYERWPNAEAKADVGTGAARDVLKLVE